MILRHPAVRKKLRKLASLHAVDPREDVSKIRPRFYVVPASRRDQGKQDRNSFTAGIGASKKEILPIEHEMFYVALAGIVVYLDLRIFQKARQGEPVRQRIFGSFSEEIGGCQSCEFQYCAAQLLDERFDFSPADGESNCRSHAASSFFYLVNPVVEVEDPVSFYGVHFEGLEEFASCVCIAAGFNLSAISKERIETPGCICLDNADVILEEGHVLRERLIRGEMENDERVPAVSTIDSHFPFADVALEVSVLNFDLGVIGLNNARGKRLAFENIVEWFSKCRAGLHPIRLRGARNDRMLAIESFLLPVIWQRIIKFANADVSQQSWCGVTAGDRRAGFLGGDDILFAFRAGTHFLFMLKAFEAMAESFELICNFVADEDGFHVTPGTDAMLGFDQVWHRFYGQVLLENMLDVITGLGCRFRFDWLFGGRAISNHCRSWIMSLGLVPEILTVALFQLRDEYVELLLKVSQHLAQFRIGFIGLLQQLAEFSGLLPQADEFFAFAV